MADRIRAVAIATVVVSLVLVLMPEMVSAGIPSALFSILRINSKMMGKQLGGFLERRGLDLLDMSISLALPPDSSSEARDDSSNAIATSSWHAPATTVVNYTINFTVGSQGVSGALDITSELVWVPCRMSCTAGGGGDDDLNNASSCIMADTTAAGGVYVGSQTCKNCIVPKKCATIGSCSYTSKYGGVGGTGTSGQLAVQNFTFGDTNVGQVTFGCGTSKEGGFGTGGVVGLNRGRLSLVSQLKMGRFSYYFAPEDAADDDDSSTFIVFGDDDNQRRRTSNPRYYTPFLSIHSIPNSRYPDLYWVGLTGIQVGGKVLPISAGGGEFATAVLATSVPVTYLEKSAYRLLRRELIGALGINWKNGSALGLDLCYTTRRMATAKVPDMSLVFVGGAVMELKTRNFLYKDESAGLVCLTILPSQDADGVSLLGSLIQTGTHMIFDINGSKLGFESFDQPTKSSNQPPSSSTAPPRISPAAVMIACFVGLENPKPVPKGKKGKAKMPVKVPEIPPPLCDFVEWIDKEMNEFHSGTIRQWREWKKEHEEHQCQRAAREKAERKRREELELRELARQNREKEERAEDRESKLTRVQRAKDAGSEAARKGKYPRF
uniref:Peptidase A1 domain-containing protein n=1 Tax=Oryza punctata TaxID=4537 RepID=A0A0E0L1Z3_ORYPU